MVSGATTETIAATMARRALKQQRPARVYFVDDQPAVRKGLRLLFAHHPHFTVCGESEHSARALGQILAARPDLVVIDPVRVGNGGLGPIRRLRRLRPALRILVFSLENELYFVRNLVAAGVDGYVAKDEGTETVLLAAQTLVAGHHYLGAAFARQLPEVHNWLHARLQGVWGYGIFP